MKNEEIHNDLSNKTIREAIARLIKTHTRIKSEANSLFVKYNRNMSYGSYCLLQADLEWRKASMKREAALQMIAAEELMKQYNWEEIDISDNIKDYNESTYFPFIGTEEEYRQLLKKV
jgi:hypothetical protein